MSRDEKRKALEALIACCSSSDIGDLIAEVNDRDLTARFSDFLARLAAVRDEAKR